MQYQACIPFAPIVLGIQCTDTALIGIDFLPHDTALLPPTTPFAQRVCEVLQAYLHQPATTFDLPTSTQGTPYQQKVWAEIRRIPAGEVITYAQLAQRIDSGARAVANACGANPLPILTPCHRVIAANGLGGFMRGKLPGALNIKRWLLAHEGAL